MFDTLCYIEYIMDINCFLKLKYRYDVAEGMLEYAVSSHNEKIEFVYRCIGQARKGKRDLEGYMKLNKEQIIEFNKRRNTPYETMVGYCRSKISGGINAITSARKQVHTADDKMKKRETDFFDIKNEIDSYSTS